MLVPPPVENKKALSRRNKIVADSEQSASGREREIEPAVPESGADNPVELVEELILSEYQSKDDEDENVVSPPNSPRFDR